MSTVRFIHATLHDIAQMMFGLWFGKEGIQRSDVLLQRLIMIVVLAVYLGLRSYVAK